MAALPSSPVPYATSATPPMLTATASLPGAARRSYAAAARTASSPAALSTAAVAKQVLVLSDEARLVRVDLHLMNTEFHQAMRVAAGIKNPTLRIDTLRLVATAFVLSGSTYEHLRSMIELSDVLDDTFCSLKALSLANALPHRCDEALAFMSHVKPENPFIRTFYQGLAKAAAENDWPVSKMNALISQMFTRFDKSDVHKIIDAMVAVLETSIPPRPVAIASLEAQKRA